MKFARETDLLRDAIANWFAPGFFNTIRDEREFQVGTWPFLVRLLSVT
jgi:hypothetical protein